MFAQNLRRTLQRTGATKNVLNAMRVQQAPTMKIAQQSLMFSQSQRTFSSFELIERSTQKLNKALDQEVKYESENYTQLEDIETFLNESGFKFQETDGGVQMSLSKNVGDKKVEVLFEAR